MLRTFKYPALCFFVAFILFWFSLNSACRLAWNTLFTQLDSNSLRSVCLCLVRAGIEGGHYQLGSVLSVLLLTLAICWVTPKLIWTIGIYTLPFLSTPCYPSFSSLPVFSPLLEQHFFDSQMSGSYGIVSVHLSCLMEQWVFNSACSHTPFTAVPERTLFAL